MGYVRAGNVEFVFSLLCFVVRYHAVSTMIIDLHKYIAAHHRLCKPLTWLIHGSNSEVAARSEDSQLPKVWKDIFTAQLNRPISFNSNCINFVISHQINGQGDPLVHPKLLGDQSYEL